VADAAAVVVVAAGAVECGQEEAGAHFTAAEAAVGARPR
jgi:hypothetical protein